MLYVLDLLKKYLYKAYTESFVHESTVLVTLYIFDLLKSVST